MFGGSETISWPIKNKCGKILETEKTDKKCEVSVQWCIDSRQRN